MTSISTDRIRNVVLAAHSGSGKTSLADAMFYATGATNRKGKVDDQTSVSDYEPEEQSRGSSIQLAVVPCEWTDHKVNILDTPGYPDFRGDMLSAMRVADAALIVVSAASGLEVGTLQAWQAAADNGLPTAFVVNKLDRSETDFDATVSEIQSAFGNNCIAVQSVDGSADQFSEVQDALIAGTLEEDATESLVESDDDLMMKYLEGEEISGDDLKAGMRMGILNRALFPIFAASAETSTGVSDLLDAIVAYLPAPSERALEEVSADMSANFIFKTSADPFVGKVSYLRVYGAELTPNSQLAVARTGDNERIALVYQPIGKELESVGSVATGDIAAVTKLNAAATSDTLCTAGNLVELPAVPSADPAFALAVNPVAQSDVDKMAGALARITEEDPTLRIERNAETSQTVLHGLGDIHVEVAIQRIARKFDVNLGTTLPKIAYRETIGANADIDYRHKKQSGGSGQFGHVMMRIAPTAPEDAISFSSSVVGGNVPKEYIPSVEKGVRNAAAKGVLAGFPVVGVHCELYDGKSHSVDSSGIAFEIAGSMGFRQGLRDARPQLLEPIMIMEVTVPDDNAGDVMGDLNRKRARISGMEPLGNGYTSIKAEAPVSMMQRYAADLRSLTQARGVFDSKIDHYEPVPQQDMGKVIAQYTGAD